MDVLKEEIDRNEHFMDIKNTLWNSLVGTGRISSKDRIEIVGKSISGDFARIEIHAFHERKKHPFVYWNICLDMARELVHWDTSTFYYI